MPEVRRAVAQRGLDREPIEPRAEQRFPEIAPEAVLEEIGGAVVDTRRGLGRLLYSRCQSRYACRLAPISGIFSASYKFDDQRSASCHCRLLRVKSATGATRAICVQRRDVTANLRAGEVVRVRDPGGALVLASDPTE
jgi:hypothetical protein